MKQRLFSRPTQLNRSQVTRHMNTVQRLECLQQCGILVDTHTGWYSYWLILMNTGWYSWILVDTHTGWYSYWLILILVDTHIGWYSYWLILILTGSGWYSYWWLILILVDTHDSDVCNKDCHAHIGIFSQNRCAQQPSKILTKSKTKNIRMYQPWSSLTDGGLYDKYWLILILVDTHTGWYSCWLILVSSGWYWAIPWEVKPTGLNFKS